MINPLNTSALSGHSKGCSCCSGHTDLVSKEFSRREFVKVTGTSALGAVALSGLSWAALSPPQSGENHGIKRKALVVKPIFTYDVPSRRDQTSWRSWGGIQTEKDADLELIRIQDEIKSLQSKADFPIEFLPVNRVRKTGDL